MAKAVKKAMLGRLQATARLSRTALAARLMEHGLYAGQEQVILALEESEGLLPGELAAALNVRPPTVTKAVNRLCTQGFVERQAVGDNGRQAFVRLTAAGRAKVQSIRKSLRKTEKQALKGLDKKDLKSLVRVLTRIEENLSKVDEAADLREQAVAD